ALYEPELIGSDGSTLTSSDIFSMLEGETGLLDFSVRLGNQLNPKNVSVEIGNVPAGFELVTSSGEALSYNPTSGLFSVSANKLTNGLTIQSSSNATDAQKNLMGSFDIDLTAKTSYALSSGTIEKSTSLTTSLNILPVTDGVKFESSVSFDEDTSVALSSFVSKNDATENIEEITFAQNDNLNIKYPGQDSYLSLDNGPIVLSGNEVSNLSEVLIKAGDHASVNTELEIIVKSQAVNGNLTGNELTQTNIIPISINPVADELVTGINGSSGQITENVATLFELKDNTTGLALTESLVNDEDVSQNAYLEIDLDIASFSSPDISETTVAKFTGDGIVAGSRIVVGTGISSVYYNATQVTGDEYKIEITTDTSNFSLTETVLQIPKNNSGYGPKELSMTVSSVDGTEINVGGSTTQKFEILSLDPAVPHVGLADDLEFDDYSSSQLTSVGIDLTDAVRVPGINESHILELVGLPQGVTIKVGDTVKLSSTLHSHNKSESLQAVQISASEIEHAKILLPTGIIDATDALTFKARVGAADGIINETGETRYSYTRMIEFNSKGNASVNSTTADNDLVWNTSGSMNLGSGDDIVFVKDSGSGTLNGAGGEDAIIFSEISSNKNVIIDLNQAQYVIQSPNSRVEDASNIVRQVTGFETVVGSSGNDTIVGSGTLSQNLTLKGGAGDDYIIGGAGDDTILGGLGNDLLSGTAGANTFIIEADNSNDEIVGLSSSDKIVFTGFNLNKDGLNLPPQLTVIRSNGENSDWKISITSINSAVSNTILLAGSASQFTSAESILTFLRDKVEFNENIDAKGLNPFVTDFGLDIPVLDILKDSASDRDNYFGATLNFDDISSTLDVLADAKFNQALSLADDVSGFNAISGFSTAIDGASYKGMAGSKGNDTLVAKDENSVLYGGDGGSDRLIGGDGDDTLIASGYADDGIDQLTGGAGSDMFALINPSEINSTLQKIYEVKIEDFSRSEGDRVLLVGYDTDDTLELSSVDQSTNIQTATVNNGTNDSLTIYFDLSFAREFDSNFTLRMADFDKIDAA
ncbi:hypothetical protein OAM77_05140, partial [Alphaproteobacteria bacterium]|nr:hypothetical protein [Alphaproteobacteria bacterium]